MIRTLVVEDNPVAAEAHRRHVTRVPGFAVAGVARSGREALRFLESAPVDLVLLDLYLPDTHGLALLRSIRSAGHTADVIAVTSARDLAVVRAAVSAGVVQYLIKPFTFAALRDKLQGYARFRARVGGTGETDQVAVDAAFGSLRAGALPKGMSTQTLESVATVLAAHPDGLSATATATEVGVSRVTARRYLEHLADNGLASRQPRYGAVGRPEVWYRRAGP
ncbi:response regulator [Actinokineospora auranticolor]|uniref:response regulator n=1 Tax=Actinokineospora auranticolor TaxID=155976 RepID=UPI000CECDEEB|nr:response regulator [Actinokineospora auranticolor]